MGGISDMRSSTEGMRLAEEGSLMKGASAAMDDNEQLTGHSVRTTNQGAMKENLAGHPK